MSIKFEFLPNAGEAILITIDDFTILLDTGSSHPFRSKEFKKLKRPVPKVDMIIVTHIDSDHIGGLYDLLNDIKFRENLQYLIFNEPSQEFLFHEHDPSNLRSAKQATLVSTFIRTKLKDLSHIKKFHTTNYESVLGNIINGFKITLLSPSEDTLEEPCKGWKSNCLPNNLRSAEKNDFKSSIETLSRIPFVKDTSLTNKSSIAFILDYEMKSYLFLGDAHIDEVNKELLNLKQTEQHDLKFEFVKLSHHGSKHNINSDFINLIMTNNYIICRNKKSSTSFTLPDRESIAKIVFFTRERKNTEKLNFYVTKEINEHLNFNKEFQLFNFEIHLLTDQF